MKRKGIREREGDRVKRTPSPALFLKRYDFKRVRGCFMGGGKFEWMRASTRD